MLLTHSQRTSWTIGLTAAPARTALLLALAAGLAAGFLIAPADPSLLADRDLTRLLRAMAALKLLFVAASAALMFWRMQAPIGPASLSLYVIAAATMATGPGLIWTMAHVAIGAALLHLGLIASCVMLWRDPEVARLLTALAARRRATT